MKMLQANTGLLQGRVDINPSSDVTMLKNTVKGTWKFSAGIATKKVCAHPPSKELG